MGKDINHVSYDPFNKKAIFSSLYNEHKKKDKMYYYDGKKVEEIIVDIIPNESRIVNVFSSCGTGLFIHLGNIFYFLNNFDLILIFFSI